MQFLVLLSICVVAVAGNAHYSYVPASTSSLQGVEVLEQKSIKSTAPQIVRLHQEIRENVANNVQFETSNGIRSEDNTQILPGTPHPQNPNVMWNRIAKSGFYEYTSPEGVPVNIRWTADGLHGFQAFGSVIPTSPPVPSAPAAPQTGNGYY